MYICIYIYALLCIYVYLSIYLSISVSICRHIYFMIQLNCVVLVTNKKEKAIENCVVDTPTRRNIRIQIFYIENSEKLNGDNKKWMA